MYYIIWKITDCSASARNTRLTHIVCVDAAETWHEYMPKLIGYADDHGISDVGRYMEAVGVTDSEVVYL